MTMLPPTPQSLRPTVYQSPTTVNVVTLRPSKTRPARPKRQRVSSASSVAIGKPL